MSTVDAQGRLRFFGLYRGIVVDIDDPLNHNRIRVKVPQVLGTQVSAWVSACLPITSDGTHDTHHAHTATLTTSSAGSPAHSHSVNVNLTHDAHSGHITLPEINENVWIMFEAGDSDHPVWMGVLG